MKRICYYSHMKSPAAELLLEKFLDYQKEQGEIKKLKDFAAHCHISETYMNLIMNDRRPLTSKLAVHLAKVLNEPRFYDAVNIPRSDPLDPDLQALTYLWPRLTEEERHAVREQGEHYATQSDTSSHSISRQLDETT